MEVQYGASPHSRPKLAEWIQERMEVPIAKWCRGRNMLGPKLKYRAAGMIFWISNIFNMALRYLLHQHLNLHRRHPHLHHQHPPSLRRPRRSLQTNRWITGSPYWFQDVECWWLACRGRWFGVEMRCDKVRNWNCASNRSLNLLQHPWIFAANRSRSLLQVPWVFFIPISSGFLFLLCVFDLSSSWILLENRLLKIEGWGLQVLNWTWDGRFRSFRESDELSEGDLKNPLENGEWMLQNND